MNKVVTKSSKSQNKDKKEADSGRIYFLDVAAGRLLSANTDGSDLKTARRGRQKDT